MVRGLGLQEVLPQVGVLLGFALLFSSSPSGGSL